MPSQNFNSKEISFIRLSTDYVIKPFDCADADLNEFLLEASAHYSKQLLSVTYLLENETSTIAFCSLHNDKISILDLESKSKWRRLFRDKMPRGKQFNSYPAMKVGRFGVSTDFKGQGIGTSILDYLKEMFITNNRTGCRYITVDAYRESLAFYQKNGFLFLTDGDKSSDTRQMYFDLILLS